MYNIYIRTELKPQTRLLFYLKYEFLVTKLFKINKLFSVYVKINSSPLQLSPKLKEKLEEIMWKSCP